MSTPGAGAPVRSSRSGAQIRLAGPGGAGRSATPGVSSGMRVIVSGRLRQRSYETKEGEKRTVYEVDDVGLSLRNASA